MAHDWRSKTINNVRTFVCAKCFVGPVQIRGNGSIKHQLREALKRNGISLDCRIEQIKKVQESWMQRHSWEKLESFVTGDIIYSCNQCRSAIFLTTESNKTTITRFARVIYGVPTDCKLALIQNIQESWSFTFGKNINEPASLFLIFANNVE